MQTKLNKVLQSDIKQFLTHLGLDLDDPDLKDTPKRVANLWIKELGLELDPEKKVKLFNTFPSKYTSMVTLVKHRAFSRCPHHLERVVMDISIAYIPNGKLLGISKLARIANYFSAGLMLQEEIAESIAHGLMEALEPLGVAVHIKGNHMCMMSRGVESTHSAIVTTCIKGLFKEDPAAREEFLMQVRDGGLR